MVEEDNSIIIESWEERTTKSEVRLHESLLPLASFRTRARTQTEETTLAQYSKRLISRTLSGIKASGQSLSKIVLPPIEKTTMENKAAYTMTEDNPFEDEEHDIASSTAPSSVSSISLDSARRLASSSEQQQQQQAEETEPRPPPAEIRIKVSSSLEPPEECRSGAVMEDWQSAWVQGGTPMSADEEAHEVSLPPVLPPLTSPRNHRPPLATRSRTVGGERPRPLAEKPSPVSPSLSRVHTDTTVTSVTTQTQLRRSTTHNEVLLRGRPKRSVTTGATVFAFGSRVGESSVSSPVKLSPPKKPSPSKPPVWKNLTAPVKRWTAAPPKLCRSQTGCMA